VQQVDRDTNKTPAPVELPEHRLASEYLANERTFLAWIRTSLTILSFGFVVAKFAVWIRQLVSPRSTETHYHGGSGLWIGLALIVLGSILSVMAAWRYHVVNSNIERGEIKPERALIVLVTVLVVLVACAMVLFVMLTINRPE